MKALKSVHYRGGIARFDIPASWVEEYEPSGGATFYEDKPDSGTLRLNVVSFNSNGKQTGMQMVTSLIEQSGFEQLPAGLAIKQYVKPVEERGDSLQIHFWEVAVPVEGYSARLAVFTYTILASQAEDPGIQQDLELLGRSIRSADYSREPGVTGNDPVES